jgi:predicted MFS family arabinose efflux permease
LAWTLPMVLGLLLAGVLSDRFERRRLLVLSDLIRCAAIGAIAALSLAGVVELWHVIVLVVVYGAGEALFLPAFSAIVPDVVPREQLLHANTLREMMEPLGLRFAGPALGGLLITVFSVGTAFLVDALTFVASALVVSFMSRQPPPREKGHTLTADLREGFAYVRAHAWLWATLTGAALFLLVTYGPFEVLLPYIIRNDLGGSAATFGTVMAAGGLGSIAAALWLSRTGAPRRHVTFMWAAWGVGTVLDIGLAISSAAWQMCAIAFFSFGFATAGMVVWSTLVNTLVPAEMLGRVSSLDWFVSIGLTPLSFALTGPVAEWLGARTTLGLAGAVGLLTFFLLYVPGVRDPERSPLPGPRAQAISST